MTRLWATLVALALLVVLAGTACDRSRSSGKLRLAFITNNASDFWAIARAGCEKAAAELGNVQLDFRMPAGGTAEEQRRMIDDLLARGVDGIAISPKDPVNQTRLLNSVAKQALLITQDSDAPDSDRACYVGTDNIAAGKQAGELIKQVLPDGGKIMIFVGSMDAQNAKERYQGIVEALAGTNIQIVDVRTDETDRARAKSNAVDALVTHPELNALVGLWGYNGPAILGAVRQLNRLGQVKIVCFDEEDETLQGVKDGHIFGTVVQQPYEFGYQAIRLMARVIAGDRSAIPPSKIIIVPTIQVQKDNVDEFWSRLNQLRGR
jgi:ribose transport system substrate-binding protein